jgi:sec-independent protein translocase protein TatA
MFGLGIPEIAIILLVLAIFFLGGEKVSELARGLGRFTGEFKKGKAEIEKEIQKAKKELEPDVKDIKIKINRKK